MVRGGHTVWVGLCPLLTPARGCATGLRVSRANRVADPARPVSGLSAHDVHVWTCRPDEISDPELLASYRTMMTPDERAKEDRFHFARDRHACRVTRALVRTTLSSYCDVRASEWRFVSNRYGRPEISPQMAAPPLRFNLSHTQGLIACAVTFDRDIGVDVENVTRSGETVSIAHRYFSAFEVGGLRSLPPERQRQRFFHYWTLKESYIKARGMGLSLALDRFSFRLDEEGPIRVSLAPELADDATRWQFELEQPSSVHVLALCAGRDGAQALLVVTRDTVPLAS
ncbi:MAG: 4'-phosphopantetheinyl transferase superfamily protein [Deltaproteobacteria bacterium]|nr:4'-phosphopantetheinyl transferase superfamily protein [Deltaproteobacteria bacterium]